MCFDYTNDDEYEKERAFFQLKRLINEFRRSLNVLTKGFEYYYRTLDKFSKCKYISEKNKRIIEYIREKIQNAQKIQNEKKWFYLLIYKFFLQIEKYLFIKYFKLLFY